MNKTKHNKILSTFNFQLSTRGESRGFTFIETIVAIFILSVSIGSLLTLSAGGFFSVRYARNQIVADNLAQEALEYIRNSRDTAVIGAGTAWATWAGTLTTAGCSGANGCWVDPYTSVSPVTACSGVCPFIKFYPDYGFYAYSGTYPFSGGTAPATTSYIRTITATLNTADQMTVTVTMTWLNGTAQKTISKSMLLTNAPL